MLEGARIPLTAEEQDAVQTLLDEHGGGSLTRRDPGETGPVVVHVGDRIWEVEEDGTVSEVSE